MKVLLTGPFGNIGINTLEELLAQGHEVTCFARNRRANVRTANRYKGRIRVAWGDICSKDDVRRATEGQEAIIHLAFIIPARISTSGISSEDRPEWSERINIGGTANLIDAAKMLPQPPIFVFSSTASVFGRTQDQPTPRTASDPVAATDHYTAHKIKCEEMIKSSGLPWIILRLCAALPIKIKMDSSVFDLSLDNRIEFLHTRDAGLACANAISCKEAIGKILLIGGGPSCQMTARDLVNSLTEGLGVGKLPSKAFATIPYCQDWVDTTESQRLLRFQRHTLEDYIEDMKKKLGLLRLPMHLFRPVARWYMVSQSPYYNKSK
jgi:nucleoside-diphosphate-sugar epimerase